MVDDATLPAVFAFLGAALGVAVIGLWWVGRSAHRRRAAERIRDLDADVSKATDLHPEAGWTLSALPKLGELVAATKSSEAADLREQLQYAGYFQPSALPFFVGARLALTVLLAVAAGLAVAAVGRFAWPKVLLGAAGGAAAGFLLPRFVLASRVRRRQRQLRAAMPDALDMLVLCLEGGSSLTAAVNWVADELQHVHADLGTEFNIIRRKMQLGLTGGEAFGALADRCGLSAVRDLSLVLIQSEKYGASLAKALRAFADNSRQERQFQAEEVAQKAAVKILFPTLLCIFPAIFIVLLGPASFQMAKLFAR